MRTRQTRSQALDTLTGSFAASSEDLGATSMAAKTLRQVNHVQGIMSGRTAGSSTRTRRRDSQRGVRQPIAEPLSCHTQVSFANFRELQQVFAALR